VEFPYLLYEWMKIKTATNYALWPLEPMVWDRATFDRLKELENKWTRSINLWFSRVKEGYIIEFFVEYSDSFTEVEKTFVKGPRKHMLEEISLCIKKLFMEKEMMHMEINNMTE